MLQITLKKIGRTLSKCNEYLGFKPPKSQCTWYYNNSYEIRIIIQNPSRKPCFILKQLDLRAHIHDTEALVYYLMFASITDEIFCK